MKVDFGTDNQRRVRDPLKHLTWSVLTNFVQVVFIFTKIIPYKENEVAILPQKYQKNANSGVQKI